MLDFLDIMKQKDSCRKEAVEKHTIKTREERNNDQI